VHYQPEMRHKVRADITCSTKARQGETDCVGRTVPMKKLDTLVADHIERRLLQATRLRTSYLQFSTAARNAPSAEARISQPCASARPKPTPGSSGSTTPSRAESPISPNGIFWVLRSGAPWRDLPDSFGPYTTCYNRFVRWRRAGVWDKIMNALARAHDAAVQMIDTSIVRVHQDTLPSRRRVHSRKGWTLAGIQSRRPLANRESDINRDIDIGERH
jgi:transposase